METPQHSNIYSDIKKEIEEMEFKLEDLHHSIDIKEEEDASIPESLPEREFKPETSWKSLVCEICGEQCNCKAGLEIQLPSTFEYCDYRCARKESLTSHVKMHTTEKPFICGNCDFKSATWTNFRNHLRTHTGEKPFTCQVCHYKSSNKRNFSIHLKTHGRKRLLRTHTGEKRFSCESCNYKSADLADLRSHLEIHTQTAKKPFVCEICNYECSYKGDLNEHSRTHL